VFGERFVQQSLQEKIQKFQSLRLSKVLGFCAKFSQFSEGFSKDFL